MPDPRDAMDGPPDPGEGGPPAVGVGMPGRSGPAPAFCLWCGRPSGTGGDCADSSCRRELDPPRFCPTCGRRLRVQVAPTGVTASCRDHGPVTPPP